MRAFRPLLGDYPYTWSIPQDKFGIALLSRIPFEDASIKVIEKGDSSSVIAGFHIENRRLTLIGTHPYSPTSRVNFKYRNEQLTELAQFISTEEGAIILAGDLNVSPWSPFFADFLRDSGLQDSREGFGLHPTWPAGFAPLWIPIDHFLGSSHVAVRDRVVGPNIGSGHYPVIVDFSVAESQ